MDRIAVDEAKADFANLVDRVYSEGISIELESGDKVVACLTPPKPSSTLQVADFDAFLRALPRLDDDRDAFSDDVQAIRREVPVETNPWA